MGVSEGVLAPSPPIGIPSMFLFVMGLEPRTLCLSAQFPNRLSYHQPRFTIFMDRISRCGQGPEGVHFGNHRICPVSLIKPGPPARTGAAGMRIGTSKPEAMVLDQARVACPLSVKSCFKWRSSGIGSC